MSNSISVAFLIHSLVDDILFFWLKGEEFYLVKWKGWSEEYDEWLKKEHLNCPDLLGEFHSKNPVTADLVYVSSSCTAFTPIFWALPSFTEYTTGFLLGFTQFWSHNTKFV